MEDSTVQEFPQFPELGKEDTYYGKLAHKAEKKGEIHKRAAYKVAQYITLAKDPPLSWPEKLQYFRYALEKHAKPKPPIDDAVWDYYERLKAWIRQECGAEALRVASAEDDFYAERLNNKKEPRFKITSEAAQFFPPLVPTECPEWFNPDDWEQLRIIQKQWA